MMNNLKKITAILIAILLTLSFAACGAETENQQLQASQETTLPTDADPTETTTEVIVPTQTEPVTTPPATTEPAITEPIVTEPVVTEPVVTEPPSTEPAVTEPPATEPVVTEPPVTEAPTADPNNYFYNDTNNAMDVNCVSIKPRYVYWQDGMLVAECFVINGFSHTIGNISVDKLAIYNNDGLIADGMFGQLQDLVLEAHHYVVWTFYFAPDSVEQPNAALQTLGTEATVSNNY